MTACVNLSLVNPDLYMNTSIFIELPYSELAKIYFPTSQSVKIWLSPIWICIGIFGNVLSVIVWSNKRVRQENPSSMYLRALAFSDLMFLILLIVDYIGERRSELARWKDQEVVCELFQIAYVFSQYFPVTLVCALTVDRYIAICYPFKWERVCSTSRTQSVVFLLVALNIVLGLMAGLMWSVNTETNVCDATRFRPEFLYPSEFLISVLIPFLTLFLNVRVVMELREVSKFRTIPLSATPYRRPAPSPGEEENNVSGIQSRRSRSKIRSSTLLRLTNLTRGSSADGFQKREQKNSRSTTLMLLTVSFFFLVATLPVGIVWCVQLAFPVGDECVRPDKLATIPEWRGYIFFQSIKLWVDTLGLSHYACNGIIYWLTSVMFRRVTVHTLSCGRFYLEHGKLHRTNPPRPGVRYSASSPLNGEMGRVPSFRRQVSCRNSGQVQSPLYIVEENEQTPFYLPNESNGDA